MTKYQNHPEYARMIQKKRFFFVLLIAFSALVAILTIGVHQYSELGFIESFEVLIDHLQGNPSVHHNDDYVIWELMVPRTLLGICVGAVLGLSGAVMQIILHNPLADPYNTGISSGAGLGASIFLILGIALVPGLSFFHSVVINAFLFSLIPCALIILFSQFRKMTPAQMILVGVAVMMFFGAANTLLILVADDNDLKSAFLWTMGNLGNMTWEYVPLVLPTSILGCAALIAMHKKLQALNVGDSYAQTIGENPNNIRRISLILISVIVAIVVSFSGTIGFVGLIAPHIARMFLGSDTKYLFPASMAMGITIMLLADAVAKIVILPVGVVTSIIGGPLFLYILIRMRHGVYA